MVWVDVGGGTARILEFFDTSTIRRHFKAIYVVDICPSLLEVARERVSALDLTDMVHVLEMDFTELNTLSVLGIALHSVDIVTFSYSFSMIPKPTLAIENATKLLKRKCNGSFTNDLTYIVCYCLKLCNPF